MAATALNTTLQCSDASGIATAQATFPVAGDNCDANVANIVKVSGAFVAGSCPQAGTYTNTWTVADDCGNVSATFTQVITIIDNTAPTWTTAATALNTTLQCSDASGIATAQAMFPVAGDNCDANVANIVKISGAFVAGSCPQAGTYTNTWTVTDDCGNVSATFTQVITIIDNTAPTFARPIDVTIFTSATCTYVASVIATGDVTNEADNCSTGLEATYVDGTPVSLAGCQGGYTITRTWSLKDNCGNAAANQIQTITVTDNTAPTFTRPVDKTIYANATCTYDAGVTATGDVINEADNCSTGLQATFTDAITDGPYLGSKVITRTWSLIDNCGNAAAEQVQIITVTNTAPVITSVTGPIDPVALGGTITINVNYIDNNAVKAEIRWDDGSPTQTITPLTPNTFAVTHKFLNPGVYSVFVKVFDGCNAVTSEYEYQYVVIYDPNGGFVTGGGWFNSPPGAYVASPSLIGKAHFGFVSKYRKGSNTPEGNTEFQFQAGNLNFASTSYNFGSLVVAGAKAIYKGTGKINGAGNYGFMVSAVDGQVNGGGNIDKFRIKIWNKDVNDAIVYDNNLGMDENDAPTTALGGGSIVIHEAKGGGNNFVNTPAPVVISDAVAIEEDKPFKVNVFPNPATTQFKIEVESDRKELINIRIYDVTGKLVEDIVKVNRNKVVSVGSKLGGGNYFAEITQGKNRKVVKLIKLN